MKARFNAKLTILHRIGAPLAALAALAGASGRAHAIPSFPGAEGFGAVATGGRGGAVVKVTNLDADGPGSLQAALDTPGPRIIVFATSGVIEGDIVVRHGDVTIAGESAGGAGITIRGRLIAAYDDRVSNIILRFLRIRPAHQGSPGDQFDGMQFSLNSRLMLDHVSVAWGIDETVDLYEAEDVTVQWSTIEESATLGHPEGMHNYGLINGPDGHRITVHHNVFAHHKARCPAIANGPADVRNNVVYDVRHGFVHHNPPSGPFNIVGNSYIQGPSGSLIPFYFDDDGAGPGPGLAYHLADNYIEEPGVFTGIVDDPWRTPFQHPSFERIHMPASFRARSELDFSGEAPGFVPVTTQRAADAYALVMAKAGALPRDVVTRRTLEEVELRNGAWGARPPADLMEGLTPAAPPADADDDGMADAWERERGLDPTDGSDHATQMPSGYTAIEAYLHERAAALIGDVPGAGGSPVDQRPGGAGGLTGRVQCAATPQRGGSSSAFAAGVLALVGLAAALRGRRR